MEPNVDLHIQCQAASGSHISTFHNVIAQRVGPATIIGGDRIINEKNLKSVSFVNNELRLIKKEEIHLSSFIVFAHNIQCLFETKLTLNGVDTACHPLQIIKLKADFNIGANNKQMSNFHLESQKNKRLNWSKNYSFSNLPSTYVESFEDDRSVIGPR